MSTRKRFRYETLEEYQEAELKAKKKARLIAKNWYEKNREYKLEYMKKHNIKKKEIDL